ncbi:HNH endonuclease [Pelosinus sp. UFO1]|uniref:HNH endonuclease n=1 Tax=Pelosinus sp. UFO1 TaxID=484770 RepID=UPI0004D0BBEA|nr:HNH endonuclease [Pelosinus sp. UFO1]AIF50223.1 hypothetical protein UFO1_0668 [Pelosinus sp. UFO1]
MWKIQTTKINEIYRFTDYFIKDLMDWAIANPNIQCTEFDTIQSTKINDKLKSLAERYEVLRRIMSQLSCAPDIKNISEAYVMCTTCYKDILNGSMNSPLLEAETKTMVIKAFRYFYNYLIDQEYFWHTYNQYDPFVSKSQFRQDVGMKRKVCPYCDASKITTSRRTNTDHFLPITQVPLLGIYWENLIVSCVSCNNILVKGDDFKLPITHPFFDETADHVFFSFDDKLHTIDINGATDAEKNFIEVFKLKDTYKNEWDQVSFTHKLLTKRIIKRFKNTPNKDDIPLLINEEVADYMAILYDFVRRKEYTKLNLEVCNYFKALHLDAFTSYLLFEETL